MVCVKKLSKTFKVSSGHLESFESFGDKIRYTINLQRPVSLFCIDVIKKPCFDWDKGISRMSNIESNNSQNGGLDDYNNISSTHLSKNMQKTCKNVHFKFFWTLFKNMHLQGPCSLRPCSSRPYCRTICSF